MATALRPRTLILFAGDILFFALSLWLSLTLRALELPESHFLWLHVAPFALLFAVWTLVFFIAGLYESRSILLARRALSGTLLVAQTLNITLAALFFFFIPLFEIAPKTLLIIYLPVSFLLVLFWRVMLFPPLVGQRPEAAILVGGGVEMEELCVAMNVAHRAPARVAEVLPPATPELSRAIVGAMERHRARAVIADFDDERVAQALPQIYNLLSAGVRFFDAHTLYEEAFGRISLSRLNTAWLARNISGSVHQLYDTLKRMMDILIALPVAILSLVLYPFVIAAIKLDDGGEAIILLPRIGEGGAVFNLYKFRSLSGNDKGQYGLGGSTKLHVTRMGRFIRSSRLDEIPQLWNVLKGDLSLIGPRPETPTLVGVYEENIPYYGIRHLIKPGVSGWAQLYHHGDPHGTTDVEETRKKLSYDLYYLKHRSLLLDVTIALKTIRRVLLRGNA